MNFEVGQFPIAALRAALRLTDDVAFANVTTDEHGQSILDKHGDPMPGRLPRGGPFGAAIAISFKDASLEIVGTPRGNNVVGSGIASRHAEDQALVHNYATLIDRLTQAADQEPVVWMISSGQSCTNCHTKQEIAARSLEERGLIKPRHFMTLYGATYDETLDIAQFYDAQYADALILAAQNPDDPGNLIQRQKMDYSAVPAEVQEILAKASEPTAIIVRNNSIYAIGREQRNGNDLYATAEVNAVRAACERNRQDGVFTSWDVDGTLYTTSAEIGPLLYAETGWTKISNIVTVQMPLGLQDKKFSTQEAAGISNQKFLSAVAEGYHSSDAAIRVFRDSAFKNRAQPMWARVLKANQQILYNGATVSDAVLAMRDLYTRFRFAADDITSLHQPHRPATAPQPLKPLSRYGHG